MTAKRISITSSKVDRRVAHKSKVSPVLNPSLKPLEGLAGDWTMELSNAAFLPTPADKVKGHVAFDWLEHGAVLAMRMGAKRKTPDAIWLMGRDESEPDYHVFYFDSRGVSRLYRMSFSQRNWKMWRNAPGFSQRFEGTLSPDGKTISAKWEKSFDGVNWEHDFDVKYKK